MEYIVIFNDTYRDHSPIENSHGFLEKFMSYQDAKNEAEQWKDGQDFRSYTIYASCTDQRNHVI
jgi:hypothetical protein